MGAFSPGSFETKKGLLNVGNREYVRGYGDMLPQEFFLKIQQFDAF